jgi:hypothetical protein
MKADPADVGSEATSKGAPVCRTDARKRSLGRLGFRRTGRDGQRPPDRRIRPVPRASEQPGPQTSAAWTASTSSAS